MPALLPDTDSAATGSAVVRLRPRPRAVNGAANSLAEVGQMAALLTKGGKSGLHRV